MVNLILKAVALLCFGMTLLACAGRDAPAPEFSRFDHLHGEEGIPGIKDLQKGISRGEDLLAFLLPLATVPCRASMQVQWKRKNESGQVGWRAANLEGIVLNDRNFASVFTPVEKEGEFGSDQTELLCEQGIVWFLSHHFDYERDLGYNVEPWSAPKRHVPLGQPTEGWRWAPARVIHPIAQIMEYAKGSTAVLGWNHQEVILRLKRFDGEKPVQASSVEIGFSNENGAPKWLKWFRGEEVIVEFQVHQFETLSEFDASLFAFEPDPEVLMIFDGRDFDYTERDALIEKQKVVNW